jgi:hypothetical protein
MTRGIAMAGAGLAGLGLLVLAAAHPAQAAEPPREIGWATLVPPAAAPPDVKSKGFLAWARPPGATPGQPSPDPTRPPDGPGFAATTVPGPETGLPMPTEEAGWMSLRAQQPGAEAAAAVVPELDGQRVRIGGYVVALDFDATKIKEFLLVPFVGACIHVPPPPPNQIVYVKAAEGFEVSGQFDPVWVTGTIRTAQQVTGLAATGYSMEAEAVEMRKP